MKEDLIKDVLYNTYTLSEARYRLGILGKALEKKFFSVRDGEDIEKLLREVAHSSRETDAKAAAEWNSFFDELTAENLYETIREVSEKVDSLPSITLYVTRAPDDDSVVEIGKWLRENIRENMMIDLRIDPWVAGGCAFVWNNRYYDYSFKYFAEQHKQELQEMIESYNKNVEN